MRIFVDMDGTLNVFQAVEHLEELYAVGRFLTAIPYPRMIEAVKKLAEEHEVYILSAYLEDSPFALNEKHAWLDLYLPEITRDMRIFVPCGEPKWKAVPGGIGKEDILLDDYSLNLHEWERAGGTGVKVMNGINGNHGTWKGAMMNGGEMRCSSIYRRSSER